jgi:CrcB protein
VVRHAGDNGEGDLPKGHEHHLVADFEEFIGGHDDLPIDPDAPSSSRPGSTSSPSTRPRLLGEPLALISVFIGGTAGTIGRYEFALSWPERVRTFPVTTFIINVSGALLIGLILTAIVEVLAPRRYLRHLLCVGLLGGWTTMSTLAIDSDHLFAAAAVATAFANLIASVAAGLTACGFGIAIVRRLRPHDDLRVEAFSGAPQEERRTTP